MLKMKTKNNGRPQVDYDQNARDKIRQDIHSNFFVEAGAGSGKTSVLVDRMAAMVEGGLDISRICAITFTKTAAGEFYARFQKKLSESSSEFAKKALKDIDLCFMGTIDSFCNMVLSEHPSKAGIPSNASVLDKEEMDKAYIREYSMILGGRYGEDLQKKAVAFSSAFYKDKEFFLSGMHFLMGTRNAHFNYAAPKDGDPDDIFKEKKEKLIYILKYLLVHPEAVATDEPAEAKKSWEALAHDSIAIFDSWNQNIGNVIRALGKLKKLRIIGKYANKMDELGPGWEDFFEPHMSRNKLAWFEFNKDMDPLMTAALKDYQFSIAMDLIANCAGPIAERLREKGELSFFDYLLYLRDLLKEDAANGGKLIKHIYERHSYFLIDEFQDTNPLQAEVFFYLTAKEPKKNWRECVPKAGSLFIVGDPKQSIYRFRNADVSSYLKVKSLFKGDVGEVLYLTRNFRSTDEVCSCFNKIFTRLLPEDTETQSSFNEIPTGEKGPVTASFSGAYYYTVQYAKAKDDNQDAKITALMIRKIIDDPAVTIQTNNDSAPRKADYKDIMLIAPRKTKLSDYLKVFQEYGIPFRVDGKVLFSECPALRAVSSMMSAAADPYDKKAVYAAKNLSGCSIEQKDIDSYAKKAKILSPAALFSLLMDEQMVFSKVGTHNAEYVYFALELLRTREDGGDISSVKEGAEFISELISEKSDQERCVQLLRDSNRVHIANLHKVKGLEAPIVILVDPSSRRFGADSSVDYSGEVPQSYLFALDKSVVSTAFADQKALEEQILGEEYVRLLYVAATRAGSALITGLCVKKDGDPANANYWRPLIDNRDTLFTAGNAVSAASAERVTLDSKELYERAEESSVFKDTASFKKTYEIRRPSTIALKGVTSAEDDYDDRAEEKRVTEKKKNPALIGTMMHRIMEVLVSSKGRADLNALVKETVREYDADEQYYTDLLTKAGKTVLSGGFPQQGSVPQDILKELLAAEEVFCELPLCYKEDDKIWHGSMDVVYCREGRWHIVDYKTNAEADDLDVKYQAQLEAYRKAFKELTGNDADALIYHIGV